jgi:hypothetical protein
MEALVAFLETHGLTGLALGAGWWLLKYYVGKDISETREGIKAAEAGRLQLKAYVEACEEELKKQLKDYDKELAMLKQDANHTAGDIKASISRIESNLADHTRKEEVHQKDLINFMGYVYRQLGGNGVPPTFGGEG